MGTCGAGRGGSPPKHPGAPGSGPPLTGSSRAAPFGTGRAPDLAPGTCILGAQRTLQGAWLLCSAWASAGGQSGGRRTGGRARRAGRGARLRKGGLGRGAGGFRGNVPGAGRETKRARSSRARASRHGKSRGRKWLRRAEHYVPRPLPSLFLPPPDCGPDRTPWMLCARRGSGLGIVTRKTGTGRGFSLGGGSGGRC